MEDTKTCPACGGEVAWLKEAASIGIQHGVCGECNAEFKLENKSMTYEQAIAQLRAEIDRLTAERNEAERLAGVRLDVTEKDMAELFALQLKYGRLQADYNRVLVLIELWAHLMGENKPNHAAISADMNKVSRGG